MPLIEQSNVIEDASGKGNPLLNAGAPSAGTSEIQTLTIGGTPTGGTFKLKYDGYVTGSIAWSATNSTLIANINAALDALPNVADGEIVAAVGSMTAGIGTATLTFGGASAKKAVNLITVDTNALTGTSPTLGVTETTPGVNATGRGAGKGAKLEDTANGIDYINTGTGYAPTWTKTGTQS